MTINKWRSINVVSISMIRHFDHSLGPEPPSRKIGVDFLSHRHHGIATVLVGFEKAKFVSHIYCELVSSALAGRPSALTIQIQLKKHQTADLSTTSSICLLPSVTSMVSVRQELPDNPIFHTNLRCRKTLFRKSLSNL